MGILVSRILTEIVTLKRSGSDMTSPDNQIASAAPSNDKILELTLVHGDSYLDLNMEDGFAHMELSFFIHSAPPPERRGEVLNFLHCWEKPLWEPAKQFVLAFLGLGSRERPMSRLKTVTRDSTPWSCEFSRKLLISPKVLDRWDSCSIQLQFKSLSSDHFSIFIRPWYPKFELVSAVNSVQAELELIDKTLNLASAELGQLIGAVLLEPNTKVAVGETTAPSNPEDPDDCYVTRCILVN